jgi:hypothetical protein
VNGRALARRQAPAEQWLSPEHASVQRAIESLVDAGSALLEAAKCLEDAAGGTSPRRLPAERNLPPSERLTLRQLGAIRAWRGAGDSASRRSGR